MNYDKLNPIFSFRMPVRQKEKLDKIAMQNKQSPNEFAKSLMIKYLANELVEKTEDLDKEMMKLRIEKLRMEIEYQKLKIGYIKNFDKPMSASATRILKPQIITMPDNPLNNQITVSPYDAKNNIIQCIECSQLFRWENKDEFLKQKYEFELHMTNNHNRALSYLEKSVLDDLRFAGASL